MKNFVALNSALSGTQTVQDIAVAQDSANLAVVDDVEKGCAINQIYIDIQVCGLAGSGVANHFDGYIMKNPGANLTPPDAVSWGTSNEKKFIFHTMSGMIMRNQDGNAPLVFRGWIKVPKIYRRMGANDEFIFASRCTAAVTGLVNARFIYKWYK